MALKVRLTLPKGRGPLEKFSLSPFLGPSGLVVSWRLMAVGGWRRLAVVSWRLVVVGS